MPIDANAFNGPSIEVFSIHVTGCSMTQVALSSIKIEGILDPSNLKAFDEEDIGKTFTNMLCPPPKVTAGVKVLVQGINVYAKSQKLLIIVFRVARHYELVIRDLRPSMMKLKVLKKLDLQLTTVEDNKKQDGLDVPVKEKSITNL